jgi:hypothetical protein
MAIQLTSWDPTVQASVEGWKRIHRGVVIALGAIYVLTLGAAVYAIWRDWPEWSRTQSQVENLLVSLLVLLFPVGVFFFQYLWIYRRGVRILALGKVVPARRLDESTWSQRSVFAYEVGGKGFKTSRYLSPHLRAKRLAIPVVFVDPTSPERGIVVLVGGEKG